MIPIFLTSSFMNQLNTHLFLYISSQCCSLPACKECMFFINILSKNRININRKNITRQQTTLVILLALNNENQFYYNMM